MKKILLTNDDGIHSPSTDILVHYLSKIAAVYVILPSGQQSGVGKALTFTRPLRVKPIGIPNATKAYSINGTPADAVLYALSKHANINPDIVISGINAGLNVSQHSIFTSGTLGAAMEGALWGKPALAASFQTGEYYHYTKDDIQSEIEYPCQFITKITKYILEKGLPRSIDLLNINFPRGSTSKTPVKIAKLNHMRTIKEPIERTDPYGEVYYWIAGDQYAQMQPETDVEYIYGKKVIAISPITLRLVFEDTIKLAQEFLRNL